MFLPLLASLVVSHSWHIVPLVVARGDPGADPGGAADAAGKPGVDRDWRRSGRSEIVELPPRSGNPFVIAIAGLIRGSRSVDFWLLFLTFAVCGFSTNGLVATHLIPFCMDHGIAEVSAASLLAAMGVFDLVGTTLSGYLTDRYNSRILLFWYYGLRGLSLMVLPFTHFDVVSLAIFAAFLWAGLGSDGAAHGDADQPGVRQEGRAGDRFVDRGGASDWRCAGGTGGG